MSGPFIIENRPQGDHNILSPRGEVEKVLAEIVVSGTAGAKLGGRVPGDRADIPAQRLNRKDALDPRSSPPSARSLMTNAQTPTALPFHMSLYRSLCPQRVHSYSTNEQLGAAFRLWLLAWGEKPAGSFQIMSFGCQTQPRLISNGRLFAAKPAIMPGTATSGLGWQGRAAQP
jgi:hypothetical protein